MAITDTHETIEGLVEAVFSVRSVPRLNNEDQLPLENRNMTQTLYESRDGSEKSRRLVWDGRQPGI
jgi:hypothetical protein